MGCFYSKDDFPTQEVMVAVAGTAAGKSPKSGRRKLSIDEGENNRAFSHNGDIPRVVIHKDSVTAAQEAAAAAAAANLATAGGGGKGPSDTEKSARRRDADHAAEDSSHGEKEAEGRQAGRQETKSEGNEPEVVVVVGDNLSEDLPRVVILKDPEETQKPTPEVAVAGSTAKLPAEDPLPETRALPFSAAVGSKGLQHAEPEIRAAVTEAGKIKENYISSKEEKGNQTTFAAPPVSVVPIVTDQAVSSSPPPIGEREVSYRAVAV